jgi:hypothetical protein
MVNIRDVRLAAGAEFVVMICGDILTMPGLPKEPASARIDIDDEGRISGLFYRPRQRVLWRRTRGASVFNPACGPGAVTSHPHTGQVAPCSGTMARHFSSCSMRWRKRVGSGHVAVHHIDLVWGAAHLA